MKGLRLQAPSVRSPASEAGEAPADAALLESPWISGAWFGAITVALLAAAIAVTRRRDA